MDADVHRDVLAALRVASKAVYVHEAALEDLIGAVGTAARHFVSIGDTVLVQREPHQWVSATIYQTKSNEVWVEIDDDYFGVPWTEILIPWKPHETP